VRLTELLGRPSEILLCSVSGQQPDEGNNARVRLHRIGIRRVLLAIVSVFPVAGQCLSPPFCFPKLWTLRAALGVRAIVGIHRPLLALRFDLRPIELVFVNRRAKLTP